MKTLGVVSTMWIRVVASVLVATVASGCGPVVKYSVLNDPPLESRAKDYPIQVFLTTTPECSYQEVGIVRASNGAFAGGMDTFVEAMKAKARDVGGDAIILGNVESCTTGYVVVSPGVVAAADGEVQSGIVIRFTDPDCAK